VDGGGCLPLDEIAAGYPADLSQVRRNDSRARILLVSGAAVRKELEDRLARKEWKLEWADVIRDLDNLNEMEVAISGKGLRFSRPDFRSGGQGLSSLRRRPATRAALMLNLLPVRLRWRESVSLHRFQNRNLLKMDHFRWHGVEDR
jgi:hypothetical protein